MFESWLYHNIVISAFDSNEFRWCKLEDQPVEKLTVWLHTKSADLNTKLMLVYTCCIIESGFKHAKATYTLC